MFFKKHKNVDFSFYGEQLNEKVDFSEVFLVFFLVNRWVTKQILPSTSFSYMWGIAFFLPDEVPQTPCLDHNSKFWLPSKTIEKRSSPWGALTNSQTNSTDEVPKLHA